jgi:(2Fe-2S) ferredoxin
MKPEKHVFICLNERTKEDPRGCCLARGSKEVHAKLKQEINDRGLKGTIRMNKAGCFDQCAHGVAMVVYPEGTWYQKVTVDDVTEIVESHLMGSKPVERLKF